MKKYGRSSKYTRIFSWIDDNSKLKYRRGDIIEYKKYLGIVLSRYKYQKHLKDAGFKKDIIDYGIELMMLEGPKIGKSYMIPCNSKIIKKENNFKKLLDDIDLQHDICNFCKYPKCSSSCYILKQGKREYVLNNIN